MFLRIIFLPIFHLGIHSFTIVSSSSSSIFHLPLPFFFISLVRPMTCGGYYDGMVKGVLCPLKIGHSLCCLLLLLLLLSIQQLLPLIHQACQLSPVSSSPPRLLQSFLPFFLCSPVPVARGGLSLMGTSKVSRAFYPVFSPPLPSSLLMLLLLLWLLSSFAPSFSLIPHPADWPQSSAPSLVLRERKRGKGGDCVVLSLSAVCAFSSY